MSQRSANRLADSVVLGLVEFLCTLLAELGDLDSGRRLLFLGVHQSSSSPAMASSSGSMSLDGKGWALIELAL